MSDKAQQLDFTTRDCVRFYLDALGEHKSVAGLHAILIGVCERALISEVLDNTGGNLSKAADILGMSRGTLRKKIKSFK